MRPSMRILPSVGSVILLKSLRRVLFPAPFFPMIPTTSPRLISSDTSFNAQNSDSRRFSLRRCLSHVIGARIAPF